MFERISERISERSELIPERIFERISERISSASLSVLSLSGLSSFLSALSACLQQEARLFVGKAQGFEWVLHANHVICAFQGVALWQYTAHQVYSVLRRRIAFTPDILPERFRSKNQVGKAPPPPPPPPPSSCVLPNSIWIEK